MYTYIYANNEYKLINTIQQALFSLQYTRCQLFSFFIINLAVLAEIYFFISS